MEKELTPLIDTNVSIKNNNGEKLFNEIVNIVKAALDLAKNRFFANVAKDLSLVHIRPPKSNLNYYNLNGPDYDCIIIEKISNKIFSAFLGNLSYQKIENIFYGIDSDIFNDILKEKIIDKFFVEDFWQNIGNYTGIGSFWKTGCISVNYNRIDDKDFYQNFVINLIEEYYFQIKKTEYERKEKDQQKFENLELSGETQENRNLINELQQQIDLLSKQLKELLEAGEKNVGNTEELKKVILLRNEKIHSLNLDIDRLKRDLAFQQNTIDYMKESIEKNSKNFNKK